MQRISIIIISVLCLQTLRAGTPQTSENTFLFCLKSTVQPLEIIRNGNEVIVNIDELNSAFQLLQMLGDMENTIDDVYLPVENIYDKLR